METKRLVTDGRARLHDQLQGGADGDLHHQDQQEEEQEPVHRSIRRIASTDHQWTSWSKKRAKDCNKITSFSMETLSFHILEPLFLFGNRQTMQR